MTDVYFFCLSHIFYFHNAAKTVHFGNKTKELTRIFQNQLYFKVSHQNGEAF